MKRFCLFAWLVAAAMLAHGSGELVATGADIGVWRLGEAGWGPLATAVPVRRTIAPWKLYVTNAVKRAQSTSSVFTPTNYVVAATVTVTNSAPAFASQLYAVTNVHFIVDAAATNWAASVVTNVEEIAGVRGSVTNRIYAATVTNRVLSLAGVLPPWTVIATNGVTSTVTNYSTSAAGGTVTLKNSFGDTWTLSLSGGSGANASGSPDLTKLVFAGDFKLVATEAEKLDLRIVYLTFAE